MNTEKINSYLSFKLGDDLYAADVANTIKILQYTNITSVPNSPEQLVGVINHHGNVLPVIDLKEALKLPGKEITSNTCIIILAHNDSDESSTIGAIVDEVLNVEEVASENISEAPSLGKENALNHIQGVFKKNEEFIMILDIEEILGSVSNEIK